MNQSCSGCPQVASSGEHLATPLNSSQADDPSANVADAPAAAAEGLRHRLSVRNRLLFFLTAWLIVLMPLLFWWNTWFGRRLTDQQMTEYLNDEKHPRHIQHALVQLSERMTRNDPAAVRWYPQIVRLASHPVEEVRNTDAWVMGQDTSNTEFHQALLKMLGDSSALVRGNAALSLVRFGDPAGRMQILALLQPANIVAPAAGNVTDTGRVGEAIRQGGLIAKIQNADQPIEVRSPIGGRIQTLSVSAGARVIAGEPVATIDPGDDQLWEALRALYLIGQPEDLPVIQLFERNSPQISDRVRQQAALAESAIRDRASKQP